MTKNSLAKAGKIATADNPWADKEAAARKANPDGITRVRVKCIRTEGFWASGGFVALNSEVDVMENHARDLVECGYASVVANPAPTSPVPNAPAEAQNTAA